MQQNVSGSYAVDAVRFVPSRRKLLSSALPMTVLAIVCAGFALSFMTVAWLGTAMFGLIALRSWAALLPGRSELTISDDGIVYRHGLRNATIPWPELRACQIVNMAHGDPEDDAVRIIWDAAGETRWIDIDAAYPDPREISRAVADAHQRLTPAVVDEQESAHAAEAPEVDTSVDKGESAPPEALPRPWATWALLAVILGFTGWEFVQWGTSPTVEELARSGGMSIGAVLHGEWWSIAAANLLHANLLHVGMNSLVILLLGAGIERAFGAVAVLGCALLACVTASIGSLVIDDASVMIGASGIGFALMGFAFAADPRARTGVGRVARQLLPINLIITFAASGAISVGGHLGGLVAGLLTGLIVVRNLRPPSLRRSLSVAGIAAVLLAAICTLPQWSPTVTHRAQRSLGTWLVARQVAHRIRANDGGSAGVQCTPRGVSVLQWRCSITHTSGFERVLVSYTSPDDQFRAVPI